MPSESFQGSGGISILFTILHLTQEFPGLICISLINLPRNIIQGELKASRESGNEVVDRGNNDTANKSNSGIENGDHKCENYATCEYSSPHLGLCADQTKSIQRPLSSSAG